MSQLTKQLGDICISCTVLPIILLACATAIVYYILQLLI